MTLFQVALYWFDDDQDETEVEAPTFEEAVQLVKTEWGPTGWTHAVVSGDGRHEDVDLE